MSCSSPSFETGWSGFVSRMRAVAQGEGSLEEKVRGIADVAFEAYRVDPRAVKVLILEVGRSPAGSRRSTGSTAFADAIRMAADMFAHAQAARRAAPGRRPDALRVAALRRHRDGPDRLRVGADGRPQCPRLSTGPRCRSPRPSFTASFPATPLPRRSSWKQEKSRPVPRRRRASAPDHRSAEGAQRALAGGVAGPAGRAGPGRGRPRRARGGAHRRGREGVLRRRRPRAAGRGGRLPRRPRGAPRLRRGCCSGCRTCASPRWRGSTATRSRAGWGWCSRATWRWRPSTPSWARRRSTWGSSP